MVCPHCYTKIPDYAKKCPNCQSDLSGYYTYRRNHPEENVGVIIFGIILLALGLFLAIRYFRIILIVAIIAIGMAIFD